jgi:hypothetical protein
MSQSLNRLFPPAFFFEEHGTPFRALAADDVGSNLPESTTGWRFVRRTDTLEGVLPAGLAIGWVVARLSADGVFIWRAQPVPQTAA